VKRATVLALVTASVAVVAAASHGGGDAGSRPQTAPSVAPVARAAPSPSEDFRSKPPPGGPAVVFVPPRVTESRLANGVRVLVAERHELPIVAVAIVVRTRPAVTPGLASFASGMLMQGTRTRTALQISDELERLGGDVNAWSDYDAAYVAGKFLTEKLGPGLGILADVARSPRFEPSEVERFRSRRLTALAQQKDVPQAVLSRAVLGVLYPPAHPYATPLIGTEESAARVTPEALAAYWKATLRPDAMTILFAGDVTERAARAEAERALGALPAVTTPAPPPQTDAPAAATAGPKVVLIDRPGATQSSVAVSLVGVPRSTPDYDAITVMNTILGGQFSSRLNLNLREKHAFSYGARSGFDMRQGPGPFNAGGAIVRESTGPAVKEIRAEIDRIRSEPVSDDELADAKTNILRALPAEFESTGDVVRALASLVALGLPLDEYATLPARVAAVTKEDVRRVAQKTLAPEAARLVVVGDASVVKAQLASLGLGEIDLRAAPATPPAKPGIPATKSPPAPASKPVK
jgi:zinc protease